MICRSLWSKRWMLRLASTAATLLFVCAVGFAQVQLTGVTRTRHFIIRHTPDMRVRAEMIGDVCEQSLADISRRLDLKNPPASLIPIYLYRNQTEFASATGRNRPGEVLGRASSEGYIELEDSGVFAPTSEVADHELTHIIIFRILGQHIDALPLWVNEGAAKYMSQSWDAIDSSNLGNAAADGSLIELSALTRTFPNDQKSLAYAESASAVMFFIDTYGEPAFARLIHATARTGSFASAMREVTRGTPDQFENAWLASIGATSKTTRLILQAIIPVGFVLLCLAALAAVHRHRRRIIKQEEQDEWEEANWRDWGGR
jgi:hypothetical protein